MKNDYIKCSIFLKTLFIALFLTFSIYNSFKASLKSCCKKGEKVSTPLDKDGRDLKGLYNTCKAIVFLLRRRPYFFLPQYMREYMRERKLKFYKLSKTPQAHQQVPVCYFYA